MTEKQLKSVRLKIKEFLIHKGYGHDADDFTSEIMLEMVKRKMDCAVYPRSKILRNLLVDVLRRMGLDKRHGGYQFRTEINHAIMRGEKYINEIPRPETKAQEMLGMRGRERIIFGCVHLWGMNENEIRFLLGE